MAKANTKTTSPKPVKRAKSAKITKKSAKKPATKPPLFPAEARLIKPPTTKADARRMIRYANALLRAAGAR